MRSQDLRKAPPVEYSRALVEMADELHVPIDYVDGVYRQQVSRLGARARIRQFIPALAIRATRQILRAARLERERG